MTPIYPHLKGDIFTVAAKLKVLVVSVVLHSEVSAQPRLHIKGVNIIFSDQFVMSGLQETWTTADKLYRAILYFFGCFSILKQVPSYSIFLRSVVIVCLYIYIYIV